MEYIINLHFVRGKVTRGCPFENILSDNFQKRCMIRIDKTFKDFFKHRVLHKNVRVLSCNVFMLIHLIIQDITYVCI